MENRPELTLAPEANSPRLLVRLRAWLFCAILGLLHRSWRREAAGLDRLDGLIEEGERVLVTFWHGKYLPLFTMLQGRQGCTFSSRSLRGEVIREICRRFGYECLAIPEHAGDQALSLMLEALQGKQLAALAPDGPRGPRHAVKRGALQLASELGMVLLPVSFASRRPWIMTRRWDRMELPLPFTRVCLVVGAPIRLPAGLSLEDIEEWRLRLREGLEKATALAEERLG
jgi:lysophospholipid acyltransferase (LPLAT)-like uncharacterized protein